MSVPTLNPYANFLIKTFENDILPKSEKGITVNPIISEIASWYERLRNAMNYRDDEVILRGAIERILKRRLLLGGDGKSTASPLLRELIWARYFPDGSVPESIIEKVEETIDVYLKLRKTILQKQKFKENDLNTWTYQLMSSHIEHILNPNQEKQVMANFMFHILKDNVIIKDDLEETRDAQVFIAVRKAYAKDDLAFLRYHLFIQFFGEMKASNVNEIVDHFTEGYEKIEKQLNYSLRYKIFSYIKRHTSPFLILDDILSGKKGNIQELLKDEEKFNQSVFSACTKRYNTIAVKVQQAIIKSVLFILLSKVLFALAFEGTYENLVYGKVLWGSIALNVAIPPLLMIIAALFIKTPDKQNSTRILSFVKVLLFDHNPKIGYPISLKHLPEKSKPILNTVFGLLWFAAFFLSFGIIAFILAKLNFNIVSQAVFIFFSAIVCFLSFRINQTAHMYTVESKQGLFTPIIDFFLMPIVQVGRYLTEGITQINILLFILDFIIETPFKGMFAFFEQWFLFLHTKRDYLE